MAGSLSACDAPRIQDGANPPDSVLTAALGLPQTARVHRIVLTGRGADERVVPVRTPVLEGDYVEFYVADGRVHVVSFLLDSIDESGRTFLERTTQLASPPLLERGARFVLTFADAPDGAYLFRSTAHGDTVVGSIIVGDPEETGGRGG